MRLIHVTFCAVALSIGSCTPATTPPENVVPENQSATTVVECDPVAYKLYPETVKMWEQSWRTAFDVSETNATTISFPSNLLNTLKGLPGSRNEPPSLRIYYGVDGDSIPMLLMVNVAECNDILGPDEEPILMATADTAYFVPEGIAKELTANWQALCESSIYTHTPVNAYNYNWNEISAVIDQEDGLSVRYGLRAVSPHDTMYENKPGEDGETHGSVVMCNILYGGDPTSTSLPSYNFAMPCPQMCGDGNSLNNQE
jgi:hypothetical protein